MRPFMSGRVLKFLLCSAFFIGGVPGIAQIQSPHPREKVIIDTDIGDDVDDAFALALALKSPELDILGVTTTFGDTETRAGIVDRLLAECGRSDIPVLAGPPSLPKAPMSQRAYARTSQISQRPHAEAVQFLLKQIREHPDQVTLVTIGPLTNIGAAIDTDAEIFRKLKRVVMMGGSIRRGYGDLGFTQAIAPSAEWNIVNDVSSAQKLFASGVSLFVMPLDSTQLKLDEVKRAFLFGQGTPITDQLTILYHLWGQQTPTLFDPMTIAFVLSPEFCPVQSMHITVDDKGFTREALGAPNAQVCLQSNAEEFFRFYLRRTSRVNR